MNHSKILVGACNGPAVGQLIPLSPRSAFFRPAEPYHPYHPLPLVFALALALGLALGLPHRTGISATLLGHCDLVYCFPEFWLLTPFTSLGLVAEGLASVTFVKKVGRRERLVGLDGS